MVLDFVRLLVLNQFTKETLSCLQVMVKNIKKIQVALLEYCENMAAKLVFVNVFSISMRQSLYKLLFFLFPRTKIIYLVLTCFPKEVLKEMSLMSGLCSLKNKYKVCEFMKVFMYLSYLLMALIVQIYY